MCIAESTMELAVKMAYNMQKRQTDIIKIYLNFNKYHLQPWIDRCKMLNIWPGHQKDSQRFDIYG